MRRIAVLLLLAWGCAAASPRGPGSVEQATSADLVRGGRYFAQNGDLLRAEQYFATALERGADAAEVLPMLLRVCVAGSRYAAALRYAEANLDARPTDTSLWITTATLAISLNQADKARDLLTRLLQRRDDVADAHFLLAVVHRDYGSQRDLSTAEFERYLALAPNGTHAAEAREALVQRPLRLTGTPSVGDPSVAVGAPDAGGTP